MIATDTETTGLLKANAAPLPLQPYMTEVAIIKTDDNLIEIDKFVSLVKPPISIPEMLQEKIGITDEMVKSAPTFAELYPKICEFVIGEHTWAGHNLPFDMSMFKFELQRIEKEFHFPWPVNWHCTVQISMPIENRRIRLGNLYEKATGHPLEGWHRAEGDARAVITCLKWLKAAGLYT